MGFAGYVLDTNGVAPDPSRIEAIVKLCDITRIAYIEYKIHLFSTDDGVVSVLCSLLTVILSISSQITVTELKTIAQITYCEFIV